MLKDAIAIISITAFLSCCAGLLYAQRPHQTVRGKIVDEDTHAPLPGAAVLIDESGNTGASTDANGYFRIENVPVGRISLLITYIGYENKIIPNVLVTSGKETVLEIQLKESVILMEVLEVSSDHDKSAVSNEMALISARGFTVEETKRYAGSFNDPARMVSAYAGVDTDPAGDNFIIVRGNSPKGIQWRLEGIDIPNPNHFSEEGATGGPINALNSQMLANSAFYTGAFAPEYGNALSGIFDMNMRKGNNEKGEYSFSLGALGTEATIEGPFSRRSKGSFLVNYRYSTLTLLDNLGLVDFGGIPRYQDLSFKVFLPTRSSGTFSVFGLGGISNIREETFAEDDEGWLLEQGDFGADIGVIGITQYWPLTRRTFLQNSLSISRNGSDYAERKPDESLALVRSEDFRMSKRSFKAASTLHHKFNARHNIQVGAVYTRHQFDFFSQHLDDVSNLFITDQDASGQADQYQAFASWKFRPTDDLSLVGGMHTQKTSLSSQIALEPRASIRWQFRPRQAVTAGFGIHAKMESLPNYYTIIQGEDGSIGMPNRNLKFSKARHFVVGYEHKLSHELFMKMEAYYQFLYDIPVENDPASSYSLINQVSGYTDRVLINRGEGSNLGIEFTLERYFADNYYFLATASLFDSRYTAMDGIERNTLFNGRFIGNVLFGKEFRLRSNKEVHKVIGFNAKFSSLGPRRFTPINEAESIAHDRTIYHEDMAFADTGENVFIANLAVSYRVDHRKISQEVKLDVQNATNNSARIGHYYDNTLDQVVTYHQLSLLPVIIYTIHF